MAERFDGRSTSCEVEIVTPEGIRLVFSPQDAPGHLLQVQTHMDIGDACGAFSLTFAPIRVQGRTYDQLIPLRSLVTIRMESPVGALSREESTVMVGLTEDHSLSEDWSRGEPQRLVTLSGRSVACVWLDVHLWYHPALEQSQVEGTLRAQDELLNLHWVTGLVAENMSPTVALRAVLTYFLGLKSQVDQGPLVRQVEQSQETQAVRHAQPAATPQQVALIAQQRQRLRMAPLPPKAPVGAMAQAATDHLADFVQVDEQMAAWIRTNPGAQGPEIYTEYDRLLEAAGLSKATRQPPLPKGVAPPAVSALSSPSPVPPPLTRQPQAVTQSVVARNNNVLLNLQLPERKLADLLDMNDQTWRLFQDDVRISTTQQPPMAGALWQYLHLFIDTLFQEFFTRMEGGVCKIFFRPKPFKQEEAMTGTRFALDEPTCRTLEVPDSAVLSLHQRRQTANVYNVFNVIPNSASMFFTTSSYALEMPPLMLKDPDHPSYLAKYGLRELQHNGRYFPISTDQDLGLLKKTAMEWNKIAAAWYGLGSETYNGMLTVTGSPKWNIGHRVLLRDERGEREAYVEGVGHSFSFRDGRYQTQLRLTRMWYLRGVVDERSPRGAPGQ